MGVTVATVTMDFSKAREVAGDIEDFGGFLRDNIFEINAWTMIDEGGILLQAPRSVIDLQMQGFVKAEKVSDESVGLLSGWFDRHFGADGDVTVLLAY